MVHAMHEPEWPDKILFAGLMLLIGGVLGTLFAILSLMESTGSVAGLVFFEEIAPSWILIFSVLAIVFGALTVHYQSWLMAMGGIGASILSLGFFGLVPLLGLAAAVVLVKAAMEGEELKLDEHRVESWEWPDKAMAASVFLTALGAVSLVQGIATLTGDYQGLFFEAPAGLGGVVIIVGILCFAAARMCFRQQSSPLPWIAAVAGFLMTGYIIVGPALAAIAMILLGLAEKEGEFLAEPETA